MTRLADAHAERAILSAVFNFGHDAYADASDLLTTNTFTVDTHQAFWRCLDHILKDDNDAKPDMPSVLSAAQSLGFAQMFASNEDRKYIRAVVNFPAEKENVRRLAAKVRKLEVARLLEDQLSKAKEDLQAVSGDEPIESILGIAESRILDFSSLLMNAGDGAVEAIGDGVEEYIEHLANNPVAQVGISTGLYNWDKAIGGGLRPGTVNVFGARIKTGKSFMADHIALHVALSEGLPVLVLDTEMTKSDHWNRMLANLSGVEIDHIETGQFGQEAQKLDALRKAAATLKAAPYDYRCIAGQPFEETIAVMRRWVLKRVGLDDGGRAKPCVIVFDYLKLMTADGLSKNLQEYQMLGFMMTGLHNFAVKYGVPIVAFVQLNRDGIDTEDTSAVSGSDRIAWLCSNLSIYKWQSDEERAEQTGQKVKYSHKLMPIVCRHGRGIKWGDYINVETKYEIGRIIEGPLLSEMKSVSSNRVEGFESQVGVKDGDQIGFGD